MLYPINSMRLQHQSFQVNLEFQRMLYAYDKMLEKIISRSLPLHIVLDCCLNFDMGFSPFYTHVCM